jgi:hypothetical protein
MRAAKAIRPDAFPYGKEQMTHMLYNAGLLQETDEKRRSKFVQVRGLSAKGRGLESVLVISQDLLLDGLVEGPLPTDGPSGDQPLKAPVIPAINDVAATPAADQPSKEGSPAPVLTDDLRPAKPARTPKQPSRGPLGAFSQPAWPDV